MSSWQSRTLAEAANAADNGFNLVRLLAALAVVYLHAHLNTGVLPSGEPVSRLLQPVADISLVALAVFFLISGIFVTRSWMHDPHPVRFAIRRAARLLPALGVCLLLTTAVAVLFFSSPEAGGFFSRPTWRYILGNFSLHGLRFAIPDSEWHIDGVLGGVGLNSSLWTLFWEGRMYVMVALIGMAAALPLRQWFLGVSAFLLLSAQVFPEVASGYLWETRLWSMFLTGILCCALASQLRVGPMQVVCACIFVFLNWARNASMGPSGFTWFGIALISGTVALWLGGARITGFAHLRRHDYSYGVYIYHWPVMNVLKTVKPDLATMEMLAYALLITIPLAMLSWHYVEAPVLRATRNWLSRQPRAAVKAAQA